MEKINKALADVQAALAAPELRSPESVVHLEAMKRFVGAAIASGVHHAEILSRSPYVAPAPAKPAPAAAPAPAPAPAE